MILSATARAFCAPDSHALQLEYAQHCANDAAARNVQGDCALGLGSSQPPSVAAAVTASASVGKELARALTRRSARQAIDGRFYRVAQLELLLQRCIYQQATAVYDGCDMWLESSLMPGFVL